MKKLFALAASFAWLLVVSSPAAIARSSDCAPVQAVFYTSGDWLRLAQTLAANPSGCAQYYISIPPLAASKTTIRSGAAAQVRSLGPNFHALAEINYSAWQSWVNSTGNTWFQAGAQARLEMASAGFDVASGDTWVVNELSSSVVAGTGQARTNLRQLVAGLYTGDGTVPVTKGMVYVVGVSQSGTNLPALKANLEAWLQDSAFWTDMSSYVSGFYQEVYGDVRNYAVDGLDPATRVQYLNEYLQYLQQLAAVGPPSTATAQAFLNTAFGPLANASWAYNSGYGYTNVDSSVMADYVSAETYAMRSTGEANIGFAWNSANPDGLDASDFSTQTSGILIRLAGAIHETDGGDPAQACEATGCAAVLDGASPATEWSAFSTWTPTVGTFTTPVQTLTPATPSAPLTIELQTGGVATSLPNPTSVTLSANTPEATFATDPSGPWAPTLTMTIAPGATSATFYTELSGSTSPTIIANTGGELTTQVENVPAPPPVPVTPPAARIGSVTIDQVGGRLHLGVQVVGPTGLPLAARVTAALLSGTSTFASSSGQTSSTGWLDLTAASIPPPGCYTARVLGVSAQGYTWDGVTPARSYCVRPAASVAALTLAPLDGLLHVTARIVGTAHAPLRASVSLAILQSGSRFAATTGETNEAGSLAMTAGEAPAPGCYTAVVEAIAAAGYTWNGVGPPAAYCVRPKPQLASLTFVRRHGRLQVALRVLGTGGRPLRADVVVEILHGAAVFASTSGRTTTGGDLGLTASRKPPAGCYSARVRSITAPGYRPASAISSRHLCVG